MNNNPIGLFDSGLGGLTVAKELMRKLPAESLLYFGDTARLPYGSKSPGEILRFVREIMAFLISQRVKMVVMACNTSSALALMTVKKEFPLPVVGLIQPGAAAALSATRNGKIGVMATQATVNSHAYQKEATLLDPKIHVAEAACPLLVPLIEGGKYVPLPPSKGDGEPETLRVLRGYLEPLQREGVDTLIMGCTHYPFLREEIRAVMGEAVRLIDPAQAAVEEVVKLLKDKDLAAEEGHTPRYRYVVSGSAEEFARSAGRFLNSPVEKVERRNLEEVL